MRVVFIVNSISRHYTKVIQSIDDAKFSHPDLVLITESTKSAGDSFRIAHRHAKSDNADAFIACGGDGTVNEVLNGITFASSAKEIWMGAYQCGSANDLVKSIGSKSITELLDAISHKRTIKYDIGLITHNSVQRRFINASTGGMGGLVMRKVESGRSSIAPRLNYTIAILKCILKFKRPKVRLTLDDDSLELKLSLVAVGNGTYMGYGLGFTPQSTMQDGLFGITVLKHANYYQLATKYFALSRGKQVNHPWLIYLTSKHLKIEVLEGQLPLETDGEYFELLEEGDCIEYSIENSKIRWL